MILHIGDEFVESLNDTLRIRDKFLGGLVSEIDEILHPRETFEEWMAKQKNPKQTEDVTTERPQKIPYNPDTGRQVNIFSLWIVRPAAVHRALVSVTAYTMIQPPERLLE